MRSWSYEFKSVENLQSPFRVFPEDKQDPSSSTTPSRSISTLYAAQIAALYAYSGWSALNAGVEDVENPSRTLPRVAVLSLALAAVVFFLVNASFFTVLTFSDAAASDTIAYDFAEQAFQACGFINSAVPLSVAALFVANLNVVPFIVGRVNRRAACAGVLPQMFTCIHLESMSPRAALLIDPITTLIASFIGDLDVLIEFVCVSGHWSMC